VFRHAGRKRAAPGEGVEEAARVADRIGEGLAAPFAIAGQAVSLSASIGIALSAGGRDTPEALLQAADQAMYRAKEAGKAHYAVFGAGDEAVALHA
jgi:diguanylate cyclase (GGDEF)-like protein